MMKLSVILMMMVAVIFAASQSQCDLLNLICQETEKLLGNITITEEETRLKVPSEEGENEWKKCWKGFFCRAEKSLNATQLPKLKRLTRLIEQYNKNHPFSCELVNVTDTLKKFLNDVDECTLFYKNSKCVHMKKHKKARQNVHS